MIGFIWKTRRKLKGGVGKPSDFSFCSRMRVGPFIENIGREN